MSPEIREHIEKDDEHQFANMKRVNAPNPARPMFKEIEDKDASAEDVVDELVSQEGGDS